LLYHTVEDFDALFQRAMDENSFYEQLAINGCATVKEKFNYEVEK
jgi:hypothetical protein